MCLPALAALPVIGSLFATSGAAAAGTAGAAAGTAAAAGATTATTVASYAALAATLASTALTAVGQNQQAKAQEGAAKYNAQMEEAQALNAERRGSIEESRQRERARLVVGAQRAEQGASGLVADTGSNLDVLAQSAEYGGRDAATARINARNEALGYRSQATLDQYAADYSKSQALGRTAGTLLTGAGKVFSTSSPWWTQWKYPTTATASP